MALPDPADHYPDCTAAETGQLPSLVVRFNPNRDVSTVVMKVYETCDRCGVTVVYDDRRVPWRRFHREWRSYMGVWFATWEHRYNLGGRVSRGS